MPRGRAATIRALARDLSQRLDTSIEAEFESGARWRLSWSDGPTERAVRQAVASAATDGAQIELWRNLTARALALGTLRMAAAGELDRIYTEATRYRPHTQVTYYLGDKDHPETPADAREAALAERLLAAATDTTGRWPRVDEYAVCHLVAERGLGWLLSPGPAGDGDQPQTPGAAAVELTGLEQLTVHYGDYTAAEAWKIRGATMPPRAAVDAALADSDLTGELALAAVEVLRTLHAELDALDTRVAQVLDRHQVPYPRVGRALGGVSRQAAGDWIRARLAGTPTRRR